jgi:GAG-pre-integrase domain
VGNTETAILGFGKTSFRPTDSLDGTKIALIDVAYAPGFHLNLLSAERAVHGGLFLQGRDCLLQDSKGQPVCRLNHKSGLYLIKWDQSTADGMAIESPTNSANQISRTDPTVLADEISQFGLSSYTPNHTKGSMDLWHRRLGHVNQEVLSHLADHSSNISIDSATAEPSDICEVCKVSKAKQQISRRPIKTTRPFESIHWDLIHQPPSLAKTRYLSHCVDPVTRYQIGEDLTDKTLSATSLFGQIQFIKTQFDLKILTVHTDSETALLLGLSAESRTRSLNLEISLPYQLSQNPFAERYGALITAIARQII